MKKYLSPVAIVATIAIPFVSLMQISTVSADVTSDILDSVSDVNPYTSVLNSAVVTKLDAFVHKLKTKETSLSKITYSNLLSGVSNKLSTLARSSLYEKNITVQNIIGYLIFEIKKIQNTGNAIMSKNYPACDTPDITLTNGQIWAACNVGTNTAGLTSASYGNYYQWGKNDTEWTANWSTDNWGKGGQGPCASGYHVPTKEEWTTTLELLGGQALPDILKLPTTGVLYPEKPGSSPSKLAVGRSGYYQSSSPADSYSYHLAFMKSWSGTSNVTNIQRYAAFPVRCIKN